MKEKRLLLNKETFFKNNQSITQQVLQHPLYKKAKKIGIYVSLPGEADTLSIIQQSFTTHEVYVPKVIGEEMEFYQIHSLNDLKEGSFHVLEPITHKIIQPYDIDLMIVPLLAFDHSLYRVGYGKGYYDKYFARGFQGYKIGLAFTFQEVNSIDINPFDYPLDEIITE